MDDKLKKAILVVSFGTSYEKTRKLTIEKIENNIKEEFQGYDIRRAFTSHGVIKKLKESYGVFIDKPEEALQKLKEEGYEEVLIQPLHIIPGEEYDYIKNVVEVFKRDKSFKRIELGRPALFFKGDDEHSPDDYRIFIEALKHQISKNEIVVLMGHGTHHPADAVYSCLQCVLGDYGLNNVFVGTIEGYPSLNHVIDNLKKNNIEKITLMPLLIVAGDHAINDMSGEEEDSWKSILLREGFEVDIYLHGLGENPKIQNIYVEHIKDIISGNYSLVGMTQKGLM